jgi:hypothetical protein
MKIVSFAASAALIAILAGCATGPSLDEQLAGKSSAERREILIKACHSEAGKGGPIRKSSRFDSHVQKMHQICRKIEHEFSSSNK